MRAVDHQIGRQASLGERLFGNRDNNRVQFNLAAFWRLEKDSNSGLNAILRSPRDDFVVVGDLATVREMMRRLPEVYAASR